MQGTARGAGPVLARLDDLERRLADLEARDRAAADPAARQAGAGAEPDAARFWALNGLKARLGSSNGVLFTGSIVLPGGARYEWQQGADADELLAAEWDALADGLGSLGHPVRLAILRRVLVGATAIAEIAGVEGLGTSGQLYYHLRQLVAAGWLRSMGRGRYEVPGTRVIPLLVVLTAARR